MMSIYGEIAALLTSVCWAFNSVVFTRAGKRVGAVTVNYMRLWIAVPALLLIHWLLYATPFPFAIEPSRFLYLGISGLIGFVIGDTMLFESFLLIGPRLAMLLALLVPLCSSLLAWVFLGEKLLALEIISMLVAIGGIAWVVAEKTAPDAAPASREPRKYRLGILLAVGGAVGQAVGLLFSRLGLAGGYSAISATLVRVSTSALVLVVLSLFQGKIHTHIGVASTLMSLTPVLLLPVSYFLFKERITSRAIIGTLIALLGVVLLFLN